MCIRKSQMRGSEMCSREYENDPFPDHGYCPPVWDNFLCWPPTPPDNVSFLPCPRLKGNDVTKFAFRHCLENGTWAQRPGHFKENPVGWTNYSVCMNPYTQNFLKKVEGSLTNMSQNEFQVKHSIAEGSRTLEMVGLSLSMVSLITSLIIFFRFRNLQNNRTRIHKNLFIAMSIQVIVRLIVYIDQYLGKMFNSEFYTIETTKYACEAAYILMEYARTAMFLWMFVEGLYLHNMITVSVFHERLGLTTYYLIGWGFPLLLVLIWGVLTFQAFYGSVCWGDYNLSELFWVLEGPRLLVISLNLLFLLNIVRVLVTKLRESNSTEALQVRKAVRAAIVLVPLLGITNSIQMVHSPVDKSIIQFAIWSYGTTFLTSFQGFFCALIYCFLNGEVQLSVKRFFRTRKHRLDINTRRSFPPGQNHNDFPLDPLSYPKVEKQYSIFDWSENEKQNLSQKVPALDPFFEHWSEEELSSHNHVDVEQIEIPLQYLAKHRITKGTGGATGSGIISHDTSSESQTGARVQGSSGCGSVTNFGTSSSGHDNISEVEKSQSHPMDEKEKVNLQMKYLKI